MRREDAVQRSIIDYLEAVIRPPRFVFAIPNAAVRSRNGKAGNAVPGLKRGMPDLGLVWHGITYYVEVKTPGRQPLTPKQRLGRLSQAQLILIEDLTAAGAEVAVVTSVDDMRRALAALGIPTRETVA
jgi:hypothetical protein